MAGHAKRISRRELIHGSSLAALGMQETLKQNITLQPQNVSGWQQHRLAAVKAVREAVLMWVAQARFADVKIQAVTAVGGRLIGPDLAPFIRSRLTSTPPHIADAFARAIGAAWKQWADGVMVPGLPWYPAFAAFPAAYAPPTPNVPTPLAACPSPGETAFIPNLMEARLRQELGDAANEAGAAREITDFAYWLASNFAVWKASSQVMLVLGKGPVPTYAPPYVPVGPVVMGDIISTPGHLAASAGFVLPSITYFDRKTAFESNIANTIAVKLENGAAGLEGANAYLFGDVSITPLNSDIRILARSAEITLSQTTRSARNLLQKARADLAALRQESALQPSASSSEKIAILTKRLEAATAHMSGIKGSGRLEIKVGANALTIPNAQFEIDSAGRISLLGGLVDFKGISHTVGRGSYISPTEVKLVGWIPLGNYVLSNSNITLRPSGALGEGSMQAFAHSFRLKYDLSSSRLRASAEAGGPDRGWQSLPFASGAQYQVTGARITMRVDGPIVAASVRIPTLGAKTTANRPDGKPWAEQRSSPGILSVSVNGDVVLAPPRLPKPEDPLRSARLACEAAARAANPIPGVSGLLVGEAKRIAEEARDRAQAALNAALAECARKNPVPPSVPAIPETIRVKVGNLVG